MDEKKIYVEPKMRGAKRSHSQTARLSSMSLGVMYHTDNQVQVFYLVFDLLIHNKQ